MSLATLLRCHAHGLPVTPDGGARVEDSSALACAEGCRVPVVRGIPRFVDSANYAAGFGLQWNAFRKTQLDSYTGTNISRDRLTRCLGGPLELLRGKTVLEVGCGAGRFTELMLGAGARVFACDLSLAVEANFENCRGFGPESYQVCQADVRRLPFAPGTFDFVVCLGVIQHTPDPEETIAALARQVRPGGTLVIDHYSYDYPRNFLQRNLRRLLIRLPARVAKPLALAVARSLLPVHRLMWKNPRGLWRLRAPLLRHSPLIDYRAAYPQLGEELLSQWSLLDTHDTLTDYYKHLRTPEEIEACLRSCGLVSVEVARGGNGVEARGRMPAAAGRVEGARA
ncbi:MAG TPA: class I SAM-dependent methyltransferase [Pyrinomonadaceae bacterium]|nr:class I SAM-dependent methyltransferase [Pyrinomonadaceae bacterium]